MMLGQDRSAERLQLRRMRLVSLAEGSTLIVLIFIAVPLKHLAGYPLATAIMGPIHGTAFVVYIWMLIQTVVSGEWSRAEILRLAIAAIIPFGAFFNERVLKEKDAALAVLV
jgi:integral membrane protein